MFHSNKKTNFKVFVCCIRIEEIEAVMAKKTELVPIAPIGKACAC
jgi:hypothetical protein